MSPFVGALVLAALGAIAAAGVVAGFLRRDPVPIEPLGDPLEDRQLALARSLADLEEAHGSGALEDADYATLRQETDARIERVARAIERRERASAPLPGEVVAEVPAEPRRVPPWAVAMLVGGTVLAMVVAALVRDAEPQTQASTVPRADAQDPFTFFEDRVERNPQDLAARLDLAHRYLDAGRIDGALEQYTAALEIDPDDAEALAHVGMILYLGDRPDDALASVERSLETDPDYPEALFIQGVILLRGLDRPADAIDAFERYLDAAPFGVERATAQDLIAEARAALADGTSPSPAG